MKGVIALLLTLGVLGGPLSLGQFMSAYSAGVQDSAGCLENPAECGEAFGQLVNSLRPMLQGRPLEEITGINTNEIMDFITGFVQGVRSDPATTSECVSDFTQGSYQATTLYNTLVALIENSVDFKNIATFACSGAYLSQYDFIKDCHFDQLWDALKNLSLTILLNNYLAHSCDINTALIEISECSSNLNWCGYSVGVVLRELTGWGI